MTVEKKGKNIKQYHYELSCKSEKDFSMAIEVAKENEREDCIKIIENFEIPQDLESHPEWAKTVQNTIVKKLKFELKALNPTKHE